MERRVRVHFYPRLAVVLALTLGCGSNQEPRDFSAQGEAKLTSQRVTGTVKKQARALVHVETEQGELVTTPEHLFAKVGAGWVPAASLRPGDLVVSARAGAVRVRALRSTQLATPEPVFNLTVAPSHAYVVGAASVLVHNTDCGREGEEESEKEKELKRRLEQAKTEYRRLEQTAPPSAEVELRKKEVEFQIKKLWRAARSQAQARGEDLLKLEMFTKPGDKTRSHFEGARQAHEAKEAELASAVREQREFEARKPHFPQERRDWEQRKRELEARSARLMKELRPLSREAQDARELEAAYKQLHETDNLRPTTAQQRESIEQERKLLRKKIKKLTEQATQRRYERESRGNEPERREKFYESRRRARRTGAYVADQERPRDLLERIEEELVRRERGSHSSEQADRVEHLRQRATDLRRVVEVRREIGRLNDELSRRRGRLEKNRARSSDTSALERGMAELEKRRELLRSELRQLRARETLMGNLEAAGWLDEPTTELDETRLRELEERLTAREPPDERALQDIERALFEEDDPIDPALLAQLQQDYLRELEGQREPLREHLRSEMQDVNRAARELEKDLRMPPSPERRSSVEQGVRRLRDELTQERRAFEANDFALANEYAYLNSTRQRPGGSSAQGGLPAAMQRLNEERMKLRLDWQARVQSRLDDARRQIRELTQNPAFYDAELEAELRAHVTLLEHELERGP